jgi:hypothetical protein
LEVLLAFQSNPVFGGYGAAPMQRMQPMQLPQQYGNYSYQASAQGMWNYSSNFTQNAPYFGGSQFDSGGYGGGAQAYGAPYAFPQQAQFGNNYMEQGMFPQVSNFGGQQYGQMYLPPSIPQGGAGGYGGGYGDGSFGGGGFGGGESIPGMPPMPSMDQIAQFAARDLGINPANALPPGQMPTQAQLAQMVQAQQASYTAAAQNVDPSNQGGGQGGIPPYNGVGMPTMDQMAQMAADKIKAFNDAIEKANPGAAAAAEKAAKEQEEAFYDKLGAAIAKAIAAGQATAATTTPAATPAPAATTA